MSRPIYKVIRNHEPGDVFSTYEVWVGHRDADSGGFAGHCMAVCADAASASALCARLNGDPSEPGCDHMPF